MQQPSAAVLCLGVWGACMAKAVARRELTFALYIPS